MIGRAGRPGLDTKAFAVVMATEDKKNFYKKFLVSALPLLSKTSDIIAHLVLRVLVQLISSGVLLGGQAL
jgi:replicative superfamily II helicase